KTTLAGIIASEMGVGLHITTGPSIEKAGDLAAILTNLNENEVLFIDEIHRLNRSVEEVLYPAMEDYCLDLMIGKGPSARSVRLDLPKFTLVGATTRAGMLSAPLRDRFGMIHRLELYETPELMEILRRDSKLLGIEISDDGLRNIASRSRGTPRIAIRLLKRMRDYASFLEKEVIDKEVSDYGLKALDIDDIGLDSIDRRILMTICDVFGGGPVGLDTLAACTGEDPVTIEDVYEPFLLQNGFIAKTPRGRVLTKRAFEHLNLPIPAGFLEKTTLAGE
nr:Holliday junction branch migration DNA helicase RuvB [Clostridiales bacterium]